MGLGPWGVEFVKQELTELSAVPVPANPNALSLAKALAPKTAGILFVESDSVQEIAVSNGRLTSQDLTPRLDKYRQRAKSLGIEI